MSLAARASALEEIEPWRSRSPTPTGGQRKKLSFNPLDEGAWGPAAHEELAPAFEVSKTKRLCE